LTRKNFDILFVILAALFILGSGCGIVGKKKSPVPAQSQPDEFATYRAYDHFVKGDLYEQSGNLDAAVEEYRKALIFDPGSVEIRRALSEIYFQQRRFDDAAILRSEIDEKAAEDYNFIADCLRFNRDLESAASFYQRSLELDSTQYMTRLYLAKILGFLGKTVEAEKEFARLLEVAPDRFEVYLELADFYIQIDDLDRALSAYQGAAIADTTDPRPLIGMAAIYLAKSDTTKAESLYFSLAESNWDNPEFLNSIIISFYNLKNYEKAELIAKRISELMPDNPVALKRYAMMLYGNRKFDLAESLMSVLDGGGGADAAIFYYLARIKQEKNDLPAAEIYFRKSLALSDTLIDGWVNLALVVNEQDRYHEALAIMGEAMATIPQDSNAILFFTSAIHAQNDQFELARDGYSRLAASDPDNIGVRFNLGSTLERMGQFEKAEHEFKRIIEDDPENALALNYLGYMYADKGIKLEEAKKLIERALAIDPGNGAFLDSYAWLLYKMGKYDEALAQMEMAVESETNDPVVYDHQGDIYLALNQEELARQSWSRALELNPDDEAIRAKLNSR
jgi:tetratricopeptide (TPR) repeat protein